jgi:hypothetical protein
MKENEKKKLMDLLLLAGYREVELELLQNY